MTALRVAFALLTRLPVHPSGADAQAMRQAVAFFPLVGVLLGALLFVAAPWVVALGIPGVAGVLLVTLLALATGGLHLDGLGDLFDALGGGRGDRRRTLEILRDPRLGAHGTSALVLLLIAKCSVFELGSRAFTLEAWLCIPAFARFAILPLVVWLPAAREEGLAHAIAGASALRALLPNGLLAIIACVLAPWLSWALALALLPALVLGVWARHRLAGITGDVLGAVIELSELCVAIGLIVCSS